MNVTVDEIQMIVSGRKTFDVTQKMMMMRIMMIRTRMINDNDVHDDDNDEDND